ncbi:MAG: NERD domain-containing protein [Streptosporangiaceae bacterium]
MEPDAADPPGQSPQRADERKGLRALFGKDEPEESLSSAEIPSIGETGRATKTPTPSATTSREDKATTTPAGADSAGLTADSDQPAAAKTTRVRMTKSAAKPQRKGPGLLGGNGAEVPAESHGQEPGRPRHNRALANSLNSRPLTSRPLVNPHLRHDPRLRVWITRGVVAFVLLIGFTIGVNWRIGLTAAVIYLAADGILRSKTTAAIPSHVRVTSAQRFTRRRMRVLQTSGYMALHARRIPGTKHIIDHVVVGPAGVFTIDSQRLDRRLPLRAKGGMLYHGRESMEERFDHAVQEGKYAARLIAAELGLRVRVRPVMVLYGPSISWMIMKVKGVDVFEGSRIGMYFRRETKAVAKHRLSTSQIAMVLAAAARALPPME